MKAGTRLRVGVMPGWRPKAVSRLKVESRLKAELISTENRLE